jgi:hypothetical protein
MLPDLCQPDKVAVGREAFCSPAHLVDGPRHRDGTDPILKFRDESGDTLGRDERSGLRDEIKPARAVKEIEIKALAVYKVGLRHWRQMSGSATAREPLPWLAGSFPATAIGIGPFLEP